MIVINGRQEALHNVRSSDLKNSNVNSLYMMPRTYEEISTSHKEDGKLNGLGAASPAWRRTPRPRDGNSQSGKKYIECWNSPTGTLECWNMRQIHVCLVSHLTKHFDATARAEDGCCANHHTLHTFSASLVLHGAPTCHLYCPAT